MLIDSTLGAAAPETLNHIVFREPNLADARAKRSLSIIRFSLKMGIIGAVGFGILFLMLRETSPLFVELVTLVALLGLSWLLKHDQRILVSHLTIITFFIIIIVFNLLEGIETGIYHGTHLWFLALSTGSYLIFAESPLAGRIYSFLSLMFFGIAQIHLVEIKPILPLPAQIKELGNFSVLILTMMTVTGCLIVFSKDIAAAEESLNKANTRLEDLLENMLPHAIAERLRAEGKTFSEGFEQCSILFADIVGFTQLTENTPPTELVGMLDEIFSEFDKLVESAGLEKIKTIGDAYMVAAGIPNPRSDHAIAITNLGLSMLKAIGNYPDLEIRIGINSGPVVAGVIGRKRFIYDLWGDAVNVAQRMEQSGLPSTIHITGQTYKLIKDAFIVEPRDSVIAKGKGAMETFTIISPKPDQTEASA